LNEPRTDLRTLGLIAAGGAIGTLLRYELGHAVPVRGADFPTTTMLINITGALLLGLLLGGLGRHRPSDTTWRPLIGVGVLGGFTTFSTFALESVQLARVDHAVTGALYVVASIGLGLLAARLGERIVGATPALIPEDET
jgi:crcB protein